MITLRKPKDGTSVWEDPRLKLVPDYRLFANPYNGYEIGVFEDKERLKAWLVERGSDPDLVNGHALASAFLVYTPEGIPIPLMWIKPGTRTTTVCHECLHVAMWILDIHDVKICARNHEALTYLMTYLARQLFDRQTERKAKRELKRSSPKAKAKPRRRKGNHKS